MRQHGQSEPSDTMATRHGLAVLIAVDFSDATGHVIRAALQLLRLSEGDAYLVHVAQPEPEFIGYDVGPDSVRESIARELRAKHRKLQELTEEGWPSGVRVTALLVQGPTVQKIVDQINRLAVDVIVLGSFGHSPLPEALMGSTASAVMKSAGCPVLVVPTGDT